MSWSKAANGTPPRLPQRWASMFLPMLFSGLWAVVLPRARRPRAPHTQIHQPRDPLETFANLP